MLNLDILNPPQKEAVVQTEGPVLVLAGAGSGKTRVLTYRIAYILDAGLAGPNNILAMTFTNKAAGEMKERIAAMFPTPLASSPLQGGTQGGVGLPWMGTFHSICVKILKRYGELVGFSKNFTIYDSADQLVATKEAMKRLNISIKEFSPNAIHSYISSAKNELIDPEAYESYAQGYFQQIVAKIYPMYQKVLKDNNAVDFDDLLFFTVKLFNENQNVLEHFQEQFKYILVDEYQDTNHAQYIIVTKLAAKHKNICCVGDDDQSIYAFRGATIKNILNFEMDYPDAKVIKLEQNYRSTKHILEASYHVISKNRGRKDKKLWTENIDGENIIVYTAKDEIAEANWIVQKILELSKTCGYDEIAVLYRTNAQSRSLEESFITAGVPYRIIGGLRFYDRKEIKDIVSYLRSIHNVKDNNSLSRIINIPKRGIGDKTITNLIEVANQNNQSLLEYLVSVENGELNNNVSNFANLIKDLLKKSKELSLVDFINHLLDKTEYLKMLDDGTLESESRVENLKELISVATKYNNEEPPEGLESFLDEISLLEGFSQRDENQKSVTLMTIHAAKGLEFEYVFVVGMEENLFPHSNSMLDDRELEEERRLAYVAITRAKKRLHLTHAMKRKYFGVTQMNPLSRFVQDIDQSLIDHEVDADFPSLDYHEDFHSNYEDEWTSQVTFTKGDKVKHEYFGKGIIKNIFGTTLEVDFGPVYGVKELMLEYAKLEKI